MSPGHAAVAAPFRALSLIRRRRIAHPHGVGFAARLIPDPAVETGARIFDDARALGATVRLSRSIGLPEALPDPCGIAVRVDDAYGPGRHQDLLLVSSSRLPIGRHLLLPARGFGSRHYSSLLPFRLGGRTVVFGADAIGAGSSGPLTLARLREQSQTGLGIDLCVATLRGSWHRVGRLELGERLSPETTEALAFDPANTGGGIELAGLINRLRPAAYRGSQAGRAAAGRPVQAGR